METVRWNLNAGTQTELELFLSATVRISQYIPNSSELKELKSDHLAR